MTKVIIAAANTYVTGAAICGQRGHQTDVGRQLVVVIARERALDGVGTLFEGQAARLD